MLVIIWISQGLSQILSGSKTIELNHRRPRIPASKKNQQIASYFKMRHALCPAWSMLPVRHAARQFATCYMLLIRHAASQFATCYMLLIRHAASQFATCSMLLIRHAASQFATCSMFWVLHAASQIAIYYFIFNVLSHKTHGWKHKKKPRHLSFKLSERFLLLVSKKK